MATGTSGSSPATHDSFTTLATLMPRIARYRDAFYANLLETVGGAHGERLRQEAATTKQPFGGARQYLNQYLARHRAGQLQQRQLAVLFADMGYPQASRQEAMRIPAASVRLLSEILGRLTTGQLLVDRGQLAAAAGVASRGRGSVAARHRLWCLCRSLEHPGLSGSLSALHGPRGQYPRYAHRRVRASDGAYLQSVLSAGQ